MTIEISKPIYYGAKGDRKIGIADFKVANEGEIVQVRITDTYKGGKLDGKFVYPTLFCMAKSEVIKYPTKVVGTQHKVTVYLIPIADFKHPKFDLKEAQYYEAIKEADKPKLKIETKVEQGTLL